MSKGFWRRFFILLIVYAMIMGLLFSVLSSYFPKGFEATWVKLLVIGGIVLVFIGIVILVEFKREKR